MIGFRAARDRRRRDREWSLFFATDLHGAELCFRKFLNAAQFYGATTLVLGGDLTGKRLMPVVEGADGWHVTVHGRPLVCRSQDELEECEQKLRDGGAYPFRTTAERVDALERGEGDLDALQDELLAEQLNRWRRIAEERLGDTHLLFIAGNDDPWNADTVLDSWPGENVDERAARAGEMTVVGLGASNRTPWRSPREFSEEEIAARLAAALEQVEGPVLLNVHVPPHGGKLDVCARLDEELRPVLRNGEPELTHAGSTAVREVIERLQPVATLHGHIHESPNAELIGRTVTINPGSEYPIGVLRGALLRFRGSELQSHQLVTG